MLNRHLALLQPLAQVVVRVPREKARAAEEALVPLAAPLRDDLPLLSALCVAPTVPLR